MPKTMGAACCSARALAPPPHKHLVEGDQEEVEQGRGESGPSTPAPLNSKALEALDTALAEDEEQDFMRTFITVNLRPLLIICASGCLSA